MQNNGNERYRRICDCVIVPAEHYGVWSSASNAPRQSDIKPAGGKLVKQSARDAIEPAKSVPERKLGTNDVSVNRQSLPKVQPRARRVAEATPYRRQTRRSGVTLDHMTKQLDLSATTRRQETRAVGTRVAKEPANVQRVPAESVMKRPLNPEPKHMRTADRQHIMQQAAIVREEARRRAELAANAELARQLEVARQAQKQTVVQPAVMAQFEPVPAGAMAGGGSAPMAAPSTNPLASLMSSHVTINFKFNKQKILQTLRYIAVAVIVLISGYLAYDTYTTNKAVRATVSAGNAASISGTNPATADQTAVSQEDKAAYVVPDDQPRYLYIPAIGLNQARVMSVGVNSKGNIDTPSNLNDTAWYDGSAKPGQDGAVFIDGHTSFNRYLSASFNDLPKLKAGDTVTIEKGNGQRINYVVHSTETVAADKVDMGKALNPVSGSKKGLTLMTCAGKFNYRTQTADKRFIVYAVQS